MTKLFTPLLITFAALFILALSGCAGSRHHPPHPRHGYDKPIPPGHQKKYYNRKSAKPFAPGQRKKWRD